MTDKSVKKQGKADKAELKTKKKTSRKTSETKTMSGGEEEPPAKKRKSGSSSSAAADETTDVQPKKSGKSKKKKKLKAKFSKEERKAFAEKTHGAASTAKTTLRPKDKEFLPSTPFSDGGRPWTVTIAVPGSIIDNAQSNELKTYLAGQVARACTVFNVDEIVVFSETGELRDGGDAESAFRGAKKSDPNVFLARLLQFLETPQYLRKQLFPMHHDLKFAGLMNPLSAPHHLQKHQQCLFREGVVTDAPTKDGHGCLVNCGLHSWVQIDRKLPAGVRVTVRLSDLHNTKKPTGTAVAPSVPREVGGIYWGYHTRIAQNLQQVFTDCPFKGGYDYTLGTSERGTDAQSDSFKLPSFRHLLILFGGVDGLEECVIGEDGMKAADPTLLVDQYLNTCMHQGSNTIRTEEALLVSLSVLHKHFLKNEAPSS